ncbi:hypothetical protein llap_2198 [Limosa lapponica baueri]|uniref:Uncharacterized protein n=1 Tax=Limosa lapponica baueri TaxID=1758121 RepID=A0A2I0UN38_LIMLA|nr:hypothetical protein llap_2198 [Limosa lapponica baueri]
MPSPSWSPPWAAEVLPASSIGLAVSCNGFVVELGVLRLIKDRMEKGNDKRANEQVIKRTGFGDDYRGVTYEITHVARQKCQGKKKEEKERKGEKRKERNIRMDTHGKSVQLFLAVQMAGSSTFLVVAMYRSSSLTEEKQISRSK